MMPGETILSGGGGSHYSEFMVLKSPAGWYIGTIWTACGKCDECRRDDYEQGWQEPGSRETDYVETEEEATKALEEYKATGILPGMR